MVHLSFLGAATIFTVLHQRINNFLKNFFIFYLFFIFSKFMRTECLNSKYAYDTPLPVSRLVSAISDSILSLFKHQSFCTYQTLTNILSYIVSTIFGHLSLISTRRNFSRGQNFPLFFFSN